MVLRQRNFYVSVIYMNGVFRLGRLVYRKINIHDFPEMVSVNKAVTWACEGVPGLEEM